MKMEPTYHIPQLPLKHDLETKSVLKQLSKANRQLAELKGIAYTIPNEQILISTLTLQEAKESSEVENIVTTQDDLYQASANVKGKVPNPATKEVLNYREAIQHGYNLVKKKGLLTNAMIKEIQQRLENNDAGFRTVPGTKLKRDDDVVVYVPPQDSVQILKLMGNLERFINDDELCELDPLIKMAIIHHQFESIHPFYDGNGRTGRIVNILYLVLKGLLDLPILYLSRYITHNKGEYYRLIQEIRDSDGNSVGCWERWVIFMLKGVEEVAIETIGIVKSISQMMTEYKKILRPLFGKQYKHELLNNLFFHPYTKIDFLMNDIQVQRKTAAKYLDMIVEQGLLSKVKIGKENYYINDGLMGLFLNPKVVNDSTSRIKTVKE